MINQNRIDSMEAVGDLLQQAVASGQVTAEQIEKHRAAGELGKSVALQMPPLPEPAGWLIHIIDLEGSGKTFFSGHDCVVGDYRQRYPGATSELVYTHAYAQAYAAQQVAGLAAQLAEANDTLEFAERWANHHAAKPGMTAQEALSCIQHYPAIVAITRAYSNGKVPETRNPWAELEAAMAALDFARNAIDAIYDHNAASRAAVVLHYGTAHTKIDAALPNTKEQSK